MAVGDRVARVSRCCGGQARPQRTLGRSRPAALRTHDQARDMFGYIVSRHLAVVVVEKAQAQRISGSDSSMRAFSSVSKQAQPCRQVSAAAGRHKGQGRRELVLRGVNVAVLGALFNIGGAPKPDNLGVQDYGSVKSLSLCPKSPNCVSTAEEFGDLKHYIPSWQYNPEDGRAMKKPASQEQAMQELVDVINNLKPDNFEPNIVERTSDYLRVEYTSPTFGFIDDTEFWFPQDKKGTVEYRSASRVGESDNDVNRKRIKAVRLALQKKGWQSSGI